MQYIHGKATQATKFYGIPYRKYENEQRLELATLGKKLDRVLTD